MTHATHDEFCFNTDLYQDDVEGYMCICNRLNDARHQERDDQRELTKGAVAAAEQRVRDELAASVLDGTAVLYGERIWSAADHVAAVAEARAELYSDAEVEEYNQKHFEKGRREGVEQGQRDEREVAAAGESDALGVKCPWCSANPGESCRLRDGTPAYKTHSDRIKAAQKSEQQSGRSPYGQVNWNQGYDSSQRDERERITTAIAAWLEEWQDEMSSDALEWIEEAQKIIKGDSE